MRTITVPEFAPHEMLDRYIKLLKRTNTYRASGKLTAIHDVVLEASGCNVLQGELVEIIQAKGDSRVIAEVVGLRDDRILLMPFGSSQGLCLNSQVEALDKTLEIPVGAELLGRIVDPLCQPLDDNGRINTAQNSASHSAPINPLNRVPITADFYTGVKAIDSFCCLGRGQRIGIFAGSGVGKSTLLGMIAANAQTDVVVIGLIGERGREVADFVEDCLGKEGLKRSVIVVATAEHPPVLRRQAAFTATTIAEWFRKQNMHVLLIMDSITRFTMAQREIGLSTGEPIGTRGYPASAFSMLPPLLERGGTKKGEGSITSVYTVLVEGDDMNEPVADHMRSLLDGHIVLSRSLAAQQHFPAIDVLNSISRLSNKLVSDSKKKQVAKLRTILSTYSNAQDMIEIGAYEAGNHLALDESVRLKPVIDDFLTQTPSERVLPEVIWKSVENIATQIAMQE